jgi:hypothetical protein
MWNEGFLISSGRQLQAAKHVGRLISLCFKAVKPCFDWGFWQKEAEEQGTPVNRFGLLGLETG